MDEVGVGVEVGVEVGVGVVVVVVVGVEVEVVVEVVVEVGVGVVDEVVVGVEVRVITTSLDPGLEYATAVWQETTLVAAYFRPPLPGPFRPDVVVIEFPKYYEGGAPPNKVIELAFSAGIQAGNLGCHPLALPERVNTVALPKPEIERRVRKVLTPTETATLNGALAQTPAGMRNNVVDAVRHGLVHFRRMLP